MFVDFRRCNGCAVGGGRLKRAIAIESLRWRQHFGRGSRLADVDVSAVVRAACTRRRRSSQRAQCRDPPQHLDEQARHRQVRPVGVGGDVEKHDLAFAASRRGDERRAILEPRPHFHVRRQQCGIGENLALDRYVGRDGETGEQACPRRTARAAAASTTTARRRVSGHRAASRTGSRSSPPFSRRGPAKRTSTPPLFTQSCDLLRSFARQRADVGQHHHGGVLSSMMVFDAGDKVLFLSARSFRRTAAPPAGCNRAAPAAAEPAPALRRR